MRQLVENAVPAALARDVVAALDSIGWTRYALVDRGLYNRVDLGSSASLAPPTPTPIAALVEVMTRLGSTQLGFPVRLVGARALRLVRGDYVLSHHDEPHAAPLLEAIADLSTTPSDFAVHYREGGRPHFVVPNRPRVISLVARTPATAANHTYVSRRHAGEAIVRFVGRFVT